MRILILVVALLASGAASAQGDFPSRPLRLITPFNPGGAIDIYSRLLAEPLGKRLGQNVVVEAIAGANTIAGTQQLVRAAPDGHTFMVTTMSTAVNNRFREQKPPYDPDRDLVPVTQLSLGTVLLVAPAKAPYGDARGLVDWIRAQGRPVTYGSWGIGSWGHIAGLILARDHGLTLEHVPYKGDVPALTDMQNGTLDLTFSSPTSAKPRIAAGTAKAVAMTGPRRSASMPEVPTFGEQGVANIDLTIWVGAYAPAGTPKPLVERLQRELRAVLELPEVREKMVAQGQVPIGNAPDEFAAAQAADVARWGALVRDFGLRLQ